MMDPHEDSVKCTLRLSLFFSNHTPLNLHLGTCRGLSSSLHALKRYVYLRGLSKIAMVPGRYHGSNPDHTVDRWLSLPGASLTWQGSGMSWSAEKPSLLAVRLCSGQSTSLCIHRSAVQYSQVPLPLHNGH